MSQPSRYSGARRRSGFTLVELLVTVAIAALLIAIAVPALKLNMRGQAVREAARQINSFLDEARSQAAATGRPFGVMIERDGNGVYGNPARAFRLYHCETPPPYTGDFLPSSSNVDPRLRYGSRAYFPAPANWNGNLNAFIGTVILTFATQRLVTPGDEISFDGSAVRYNVVRVTDVSPAASDPRLEVIYSHPNVPSPTMANETIFISTTLTANDPFDPAQCTVTAGHNFRVYRQPVKIASSVLELPRSGAIDLQWSGIGAAGTQFSFLTSGTSAREFALNPIVILFDPSGSVRSVTAPYLRSTSPPLVGIEPQQISEPIYLLIGRVDQIDGAVNLDVSPEPENLAAAINMAADPISNVLDVESLWLVINPSNAATLTVQNAGLNLENQVDGGLDYDPNQLDYDSDLGVELSKRLLYSRQFARQTSGVDG